MNRAAFLAKWTVLALAIATACNALAERADKNKPLNIVADSMTHDEARQVSVLEGAVLLTKGTLVIKASRVEIRKDSQENQYVTAISKEGTPVFFRQKREGYDEFMEGEAARIEYDGKLDVMRLSGKAVMRRLRGATLADESLADLIVFDNTSETMTLAGVSTGGNTPAKRVRMMLSPNPKAQDSGVLAPPVQQNQLSVPVLRPSSQIK